LLGHAKLADMSQGDEVTRYKQELKGATLRVTSGRVAVLRALETSPHATAEKVFDLISGDLPGTSPQAVYLVLNDLTRVGLIRRFEPAGSAALYERRIGDNHHHLVCETCGTVQDVDCAVGQAPCLTPSGGGGVEGFRVREAEVTFWGVCARCRGMTNP
jgi:Fe2+ or Zn2+ uptake regulation protein